MNAKKFPEFKESCPICISKLCRIEYQRASRSGFSLEGRTSGTIRDLGAASKELFGLKSMGDTPTKHLVLTPSLMDPLFSKTPLDARIVWTCVTTLGSEFGIKMI